MNIEAMKMALALNAWTHFGECRATDGPIPTPAEVDAALRAAIKQAQKQEHVIDCPRCGHCCPQAAQAQKQERPLDGAAKIFQAMIDALQAGDGYESVLRQFGYAESFEQAQVANNDTSQERVAETAKQEHEQAEKQETVATCKQSLQVQQEPVAWLHTKLDGVVVPHRPADLDRHPDRWEGLHKTPPPCPTCEALARTVMLDQTSHDTTPPPRQWVGLTNEERDAIYNTHEPYADLKAIEAKLKEKNT